MECACGEVAVMDALCKGHFMAAYEATVHDTIKRFSLFDKSTKIAVACSGGKDSTVLLHLLDKAGYDVEALAIDEGIEGYRDETLEGLKVFCRGRGIKLRIASYKDAYGTTLDAFLAKNPHARACAACGVWRRSLLNKEAQGFDVLATGHNLDDEAQSILMNLVRAQIQVLSRLGPKSGIAPHEGFTQRVKPLYLNPEKHTAAFALLAGLQPTFSECPNAPSSSRGRLRDLLNELERESPGTKRRLVEWFLENKESLQDQATVSIGACASCGAPSSREICAACSLGVIVKAERPLDRL